MGLETYDSLADLFFGLHTDTGLYNVAKIADRSIADLISQDISPNGNQKGLSVNHYLIKMIYQILLSLDQNPSKDKRTVISNITD